MPELELSEAAEEILAGLWARKEETGESSSEVTTLDPEPEQEALRELLESGLIEQRAGRLSLTAPGEKQAASVIRRERLAERLLADVLNVGDKLAAETACKFEHLLIKGLDDEICTLLGHPRVCPHGHAIPPGECCRKGASSPRKVVSSLADLSPGQGGTVAYIHTRQREMLRRLLTMGAVPGSPIVLRQKFPSFVFELGHGQIAVDWETARDIYVRVSAGPPPPPRPPHWFMRPFRGFRWRGRPWR